MQARMDQMQAETARLKNEIHQEQSVASFPSSGPLASINPGPAVLAKALNHTGVSGEETAGVQDQNEDRISKLEEEQELLKAKVNDQYQTKIGSGSNYRVRLSGIVLMNMFTNRGAVENQDVPTWAVSRSPLSSNASFGATMRQSEIGLDVFGPELAGAKTHGEMQMDFFGEVPNVSNGVSMGQMRLRRATARMDWKNTSIIAGQDSLFFSPLSPTSFASLAEPALSYAGNLWAWTPQIRVEHEIHVSDTSGIILQAGILDPLAGEPPRFSTYRYPGAGESSGKPALAARVAWTQTAFGQPLTLGVGGYFSEQKWGYGRKVEGWAGTADVNVPLGRLFTFSGEFYRGRAIGGLGGGLGRSVLYNGPLATAATSVEGLNTIGGWGQIGFHPAERLEFNGAFGEDNPLAEDFGYFSGAQSYFDSKITRNRGAFTNVIYHPRSNLILSLEFRRLWTFDVYDAERKANQVNLGVGVLF
jgi:hypothetical protein